METLHIKPLHGADGYLRWKESVLLRLHTVGVAHVLSDDPPAAGAQEAKKWARDDALALWQAVARTYEPDSFFWQLRFDELEFHDDETLLERVARAEALAIAACGGPRVSDGSVAYMVCTNLPDVAKDAIMHGQHGDEKTMDGVWRSAQAMERVRNSEQAWLLRQEREAMISSGTSGHVTKKRRRSRRADGTNNL
ncbi:hypothetical protein PVAP13_6NG114200 [Panicum virgatum]|uniref:Uncharacterized protein n=1 Tax=Panicum virgatum TaxID=38727 RepID=A0A8T0QZH6_PANVG|nr:hypothetical protein PVAP13_6NG114200 [Panicum virgatum]